MKETPTSNTARDSFNVRLMEFIACSPTPFHAVANMVEMLRDAGFQFLPEDSEWQLEPGRGYYTTRNGSSLVAFIQGSAPLAENGIRLVGAHTDSPCLMVKPEPETTVKEYFKLGVEVYGGALLNPWFDRDLSIAGRLVYRAANGSLQQALVDFQRPVAVVPSLAIHLDRQANEGRTVNPQTDIPPLLFQVGGDRPGSFRAVLAEQFLCHEPGAEVLDFDLYCYDVQKPSLVGLYNDFLASARLDNLLSCFVGLEALLQGDGKQTCILVCNDHEEVGSASACGAQGPMLASVVERLVNDPAKRTRVINNSLLISADNAHGVHPNYLSKHDENHGPLLNRGPVIKVNARQRYATNSLTASRFRDLARTAGVPVQTFVSRTDMGCGSTIGPITATELGVPTLDVGVPTFAMHSVRELAGVEDAHWLLRILAGFYNQPGPLAIAGASL